MTVRNWESFSDPIKARDIHRYASISDRLEELIARNVLVESLAKSRDIVREAQRYPVTFLYQREHWFSR